jgi:hypothetical protein
VNKLLSKLGGGLVVLVILGAVAGTMAFQYSRDWHHTTVAAWFADDTQVLLVRPVHLPFNSGRTIDIWRVSLKDGKTTSLGSEAVDAMHELSYLGATRDRMWFVSTPSETLMSRGARGASDRYDVKAKIQAHPTLSARFDVAGFSHDGPVIKDQRSEHYRVHPDGTFVAEHWSTLPMKGVYEQHDWNNPDLRTHTSAPGGQRGMGPQNISALPWVRPGFLVDGAGNPIRPREGGWLIVGEELVKGFDNLLKHVLARVDDKGAVMWQRPVMQMWSETAVDDFDLDPWYRAEVRALHTTPQRVWVVFELSIHEGAGHETHVAELDAATGKVLRSIVPRL